jgi:hypothetical protein
LNYLFHRQQVEKAKADASNNEAARNAHNELAKRYERQIEDMTATAFQFPSDL